MSIDVPENLHMAIKIQASLDSTTIREFVVEAIKDKISGKAKYNRDTIDCIHKAENNIDVNTYENIEELFKSLDI